MTRFQIPVLGAAFAVALLLAGASSAYELEIDAKDIDRDGAELIEEMRVRPDDRDVADTALVFTNFSNQRQHILCVGFDKHGNAVGRVRVVVPRLGLRYVLASDLADDLDFIGSAQCGADASVKGTAVFLGPGLTDLPVQQVQGERAGRMRFPLVATY